MSNQDQKQQPNEQMEQKFRTSLSYYLGVYLGKGLYDNYPENFNKLIPDFSNDLLNSILPNLQPLDDGELGKLICDICEGIENGCGEGAYKACSKHKKFIEQLRRYTQGKDKAVEEANIKAGLKYAKDLQEQRELFEQHEKEAVKKEREGNVIIPRSVWDLIVDYLPSSPPFEQLIKDEALKKGE